MQEELRIAFFAIGIVFIVGILAHGAWTLRKNKKQSRPNNFQSSREHEPRFDVDAQDNDYDDVDDDDIYDDVGVGQARVISTNDPRYGSDKHRDKHRDNKRDNHTEIDDVSRSSHPDAANELAASRANQQADDDIAQTASDQTFAKRAPNYHQTKDETQNAEPIMSAPMEHHKEDQQNSSRSKLQEPASKGPLYSGVVTQPKPGFSKPLKPDETTHETLHVSDPPGFLLRKSPEHPAKTSVQSDAHVSVAPLADEGSNAHLPEFSLNLQDGPVKAHSASTNAHRTDGAGTSKPSGVEKELSFAQQAKRFVTRRKKTIAEKIRREPQVKSNDKKSVDQMRIDFEQTALPESSSEPVAAVATTDKHHNDSQQAPQTDVLVLNVRASADSPIGGAALLPMLLTLGFKFGEHDIFHRHVNTNGKGPILFSLTNMFKPGVFDIDNIENFTTHGVSLFMMLPIEGEAQQVFNMMHNAARKISEEFGGKILDGNRAVLSKQSLQHYSERIREFERRRLSR
jgi:cell division protein ZipA